MDRREVRKSDKKLYEEFKTYFEFGNIFSPSAGLKVIVCPQRKCHFPFKMSYFVCLFGCLTPPKIVNIGIIILFFFNRNKYYPYRIIKC